MSLLLKPQLLIPNLVLLGLLLTPLSVLLHLLQSHFVQNIPLVQLLSQEMVELVLLLVSLALQHFVLLLEFAALLPDHTLPVNTGSLVVHAHGLVEVGFDRRKRGMAHFPLYIWGLVDVWQHKIIA